MTLPLLELSERVEKPRKRVRAVSREQYSVLRDTNILSERQHEFLTTLAAYVNRYQKAPTAAELAAWAYSRGRIPRPDPNLYRPRATELSRGENRTGRPSKGGGVIELLPRRKCTVTGKSAHPLRIVERGVSHHIGQ